VKGRAGFGLLWFLPFVLWAVGHAAQAPGRWVTKASMPTPRTEVAAAVLGGKIYVIGGGPRSGGSLSDANEAFFLPAGAM
jgi:hypothetical protein